MLGWGVEERGGAHIGGLKVSLEDCDGMILSCDIAEGLGSTDLRLARAKSEFLNCVEAYYFSTQG
jgi:hypothetical protein